MDALVDMSDFLLDRRASFVRNPTRAGVITAALALLLSSFVLVTSVGASAAVCPRSGISGYVTTSSGAPIAVAGVDLFIEPDVSGLADGESAELKLIGHTLTDSTGCYTLTYPEPSVLLAAADSVGHLDLTVLVHRPDKLEFRTIPVMLTTEEVDGVQHL